MGRGWFYTLLTISTALFNKYSFKHVIVNGLILASDGMKMSKLKSNYPNPKTTIEKYGADAFRLYILHSPITKAEPIYFNEISIKIMFKKIVLSLINSYLFFAKYANIDKWQKGNIHTLSNDIMDIWIISKLNTLIKNVKQYLSKYNLFKT